MWFKRLLNEWKYKRLSKKMINLSPNNPNRKFTEDLLSNLSVDYFLDYSPVRGLSTFVDTRYGNIDLLNNKIKEAIRLIKGGTPIPTNFGIDEISTVSIDRFLISSDGYYIDIYVAINDLVKYGLNLCKLMEDSDTVDHGIQNHNLRMLTKLFINIREIVTKLTEITFNK